MTMNADRANCAIDWFRYARQIQKQQLRQLAQSGALASRICHLVHMLQCERGASNIWLCSQGRLYDAECRASRALVDEQRLALMPLLHDDPPLTSSALCQRIAAALWGLEQLPELRQRVQAQRIDAAEAMEQFSATIRHLLSIVPQLNDTLDDPRIVQPLVALYSLMQGKELAGQERALGALGFTLGHFSDALRQRLVDRIDGQQPCFDTFLSLSSAGLSDIFHTRCEATLEIEQLRRLACTRQPPQDQGENALHWFVLHTQRLEELRALEESLIDALMQTVATLLAEEDLPPISAAFLEPAGDALSLRPDNQLLPLVRQQARELEQLTAQLASLKASLDERKVIDSAKHVLMTHQNMTEEQAWQCLRKMAMDKNQRMVEIARALLTVKNLWQ
ncbi:nitrate regulatory protein NasR [Enterobacter sp. ENT03]|uniref:nitrate regulatory protein NasR n=1 Tax=Enterobacter sp. ENT03 TaxID=2854780 RepID=UPI001C440550|nr:nitrate regulatory protein NasR [Enterobacter sp. ENT03]MBV7404698.1 nitrate- and nitrite sensing domain-containing protein [Enterobacter sp. ENT03]